MYAVHFGLTERPFSLAPDPRYLFLSDGHREALAHLLYGLQGGGFVQLTGEVGTGKTTVCRALLDQLPPEVDVAMIFTPRLTAVELLAALCTELRVDTPADTTSVKSLVDALSRRLLDTHARGRRTVVIIDEAQNLSMEVLEELRLLTNIETTREKLLQVILIGQPELVELMQRPELRQLGQRVTARYHLRPFAIDETKAYVGHRLEVAGQQGESMFTPAALWTVHRRSGGVPRLINNICDRALLGAYATGKRRVTAGVVRRAASEVLGPGVGRYWAEAGVAAAAIAAVLVGATLLRPDSMQYVSDWWARRIMGTAVAMSPTTINTPAAPNPAVTPVEAQPKETPSLAALLDTKTRDRDIAFARLFAVWGEDYASRRGEQGCDFARRAGLRCLMKTGTWKVLRRLDLPAILTLTAPDGDYHWVTMTALHEDTATLDVNGETRTFPLTEIERFWDGAFVALWRTPNLTTSDLRPGMSSRDVAWLRQQLATGGTTDRTTVYDDELKRRVVAFQRAHGLTPDGIVGDETLVRLTALATDARMPSLTKARP